MSRMPESVLRPLPHVLTGLLLARLGLRFLLALYVLALLGQGLTAAH